MEKEKEKEKDKRRREELRDHGQAERHSDCGVPTPHASHDPLAADSLQRPVRLGRAERGREERRGVDQIRHLLRVCLSVDAVAEEREREAGESDGREEVEDVEREVARQGVDVGIEEGAVSDGGERETEQTRENHYNAGRPGR